jgi:hypothetical protein
MQAIRGGIKEGDTGKVARQQLCKGEYTDRETRSNITTHIFVLRLLKSGRAGRSDARDAFL